MDVIDAVRSRKSIRGFKPEPVPREIIREILEIASRTASATNAQPWFVTVLAGRILDEVKKANVEMMDSKAKPAHDLPVVPYVEIYRQRQVDLAVDIFRIIEVAREDKAGRWEWHRRGYRYFDAPAALVLSVDKAFDGAPLILFDIGAIAQTICLVALNYGLGTCIHRQGVTYPDILRKLAGIPESRRIAISISIGYPEPDFPINALQTPRVPVESFADWKGWE